jgi:putative FmdB family regulatory protein
MHSARNSGWYSQMPTYDLTCKACGNRFERFLTRLLRQEDKVCPLCGSQNVSAGVGGGYVKSPSVTSVSTCASSGGFG